MRPEQKQHYSEEPAGRKHSADYTYCLEADRTYSAEASADRRDSADSPYSEVGRREPADGHPSADRTYYPEERSRPYYS